MKRNKILLPLIIFGSFFMILLTYAIINPNTLYFDFSHYQRLNNDWTFDGQEIDSLPIDIKTPKNQEVTIVTVLSNDFYESQRLLIRSSLQTLEVRLDGTLIYSHYHDPVGAMNTYASVWHIVPLPEHSDGLTLSITTVSPYSSMSGRFNQIIYGSEGEINHYLLTTYGFRLIIGLLVMAIGILLVFINMIAFRRFSESATLLGISVFFLGSWITAESRLLQFFIGDTLFIGSLAYLSLGFLPLAVSIYIKRYLLTTHKKYYQFYIDLVIFNLFFIFITHVTGWLDYFESIIFTHVILIMGIVITGLFVGMDLKSKLKNNKDVLGVVILFLVIGVLELINFLVGNFDYISIFATIGIGILMVYSLIRYIKSILSKIKQGYEKDIYHKLAYLDPLTKLYNRLAFNERLDDIFHNQDELTHLMLIYFDMDDLKKINDENGHLEGDQALIDVAQRLQHCYASYGDVYRIGGDEFVFIGTKLAKDDYQQINNTFDSYMEECNRTSRYRLRISYGVTFFEPNLDRDPKDILSRADHEMYRHKVIQKQITSESE